MYFQSGPSVTSVEDWGVNYRALNDLFNISQSRKSSIAYEVGVQMVEIYNEQVRDLLNNHSSQKRYPLEIYFMTPCLIMFNEALNFSSPFYFLSFFHLRVCFGTVYKYFWSTHFLFTYFIGLTCTTHFSSCLFINISRTFSKLHDYMCYYASTSISINIFSPLFPLTHTRLGFGTLPNRMD